MEVFLFIQTQKKLASTDKKPISMLTSILSAEQLLADAKRQETLNAIAKTSQFDPSHYEHIALSLIHQVTLNCQRLPEGTVYFANPGGLLDHILARTLAATRLLREYLLPPPNSDLSEEQKRWWYTLFSASLLRGIGTLCVDYRVSKYTLQGQFLKQWDPLFEQIGHANHYYWYESKTNEDQALKRRLTLLLARKMMPEDGFAWIAAHKDALAIWLALLDEDTYGARALGAILDRADAIVIQEAINQMPLKVFSPRRKGLTHIGTFIDQAQDSIVEKERIAGIEFIHWIQNQIEAGKFVLNRAPIFLVPGGILICVEAFQLFSREYDSNKNKNWNNVQQGLLALNIHRSGEHGAAISKYDQGNGLVIKNSIILPESLSVKNIKTGEIQKTTATAVAIGESAMRISNKGDWVLEQQSAREYLTPTSKPNG